MNESGTGVAHSTRRKRMQPDTDGVKGAVAEEPPSRNVRVARRGVAAGLVALVLYLILATYTATTGWAHSELVAFGRTTLTLSMVAGLGVALFGYGVNRSERNCVAANVELVEQFRNVLAEAEVDRLRRERRFADRLDDVAEQLERDRTILRLRPKEQQRTVADVPRQKRRRRGRQPQVQSERGADNVIPMRRRAADALRRLREQIGDEPQV